MKSTPHPAAKRGYPLPQGERAKTKTHGYALIGRGTITPNYASSFSAISAMLRPMAMDAVAAGDGAFST